MFTALETAVIDLCAVIPVNRSPGIGLPHHLDLVKSVHSYLVLVQHVEFGHGLPVISVLPNVHNVHPV